MNEMEVQLRAMALDIASKTCKEEDVVVVAERVLAFLKGENK